MRFLNAISGLFFVGFLLVGLSCKRSIDQPENSTREIIALTKINSQDMTPRFTEVLIDTFIKHYPKFKNVDREIRELYQKHDYKFLWYGKEGINKLAFLVHDKTDRLNEEGIKSSLPYKIKIDSVIQYVKRNKDPDLNTELLISSMYFFYENKVFRGIDSKKTRGYGWFLPRKGVSYVTRLDSLLQDSNLFDQQRADVLDQYYKLKVALNKYRQIEKDGGWQRIEMQDSIIKVGDNSPAIPKIRARLRLSGDLIGPSQGNLYDKTLAEAVVMYKKRHAFTANSVITKQVIESMNISIKDRIETIEVNMERCRWMSPNVTKAKAFVVINIPSFNLTFFRNGKPKLISRVVVGKMMNQTVVFSGDMNQIVFSPYWNIPNSIYEKEIVPALLLNENYLEQKDMEWHNGRLRQKPGPGNALGKVKFLFPNSNNIYLHDTPSKSLFSREDRAYSHGCIRVERPRDLAIAVLKGDSLWTQSKIDAAMNYGKQQSYLLKNKIPVYIGYFTAWVDKDGKINFYNDIYDRDPLLVKLMKD